MLPDYIRLLEEEGECEVCVNKGKLFHFHLPYNYANKNGFSVFCITCIRTMQKELHIPPSEWIRLCGGCRQPLQFKYMMQHEKVDTRGYGYCPVCMEKLIGEKMLLCTSCGVTTLNYTYPSYIKKVCIDCYVHPPLTQTVNLNNVRARALGLPATLTDEEWQKALDHFEGWCAYCYTSEYQVLEHYLPLSLSGGTTASNCIPACYRCNSIKSNKHPDEFARLFASVNLAHIRCYLASVS